MYTIFVLLEGRENNKPHKIELRRVDWKKILEIMRFLSEEGRIELPIVARFFNMNVKYTHLYLEWCEQMGLVEITGSLTTQTVVLTEGGQRIYDFQLRKTLLVTFSAHFKPIQ